MKNQAGKILLMEYIRHNWLRWLMLELAVVLTFMHNGFVMGLLVLWLALFIEVQRFIITALLINLARNQRLLRESMEALDGVKAIFGIAGREEEKKEDGQ